MSMDATPASSIAHLAAGASPARHLYEQEIRFAVVMYGGISLAIYMNGIVLEMLSLVRATAPADPGQEIGGGDLLLRAPSGTEAVYRRLAKLMGSGLDAPCDALATDPVKVRFVIDIVSGTSAGGINGLFLSKALATGASMEPLSKLWIQQGDIGKLLNDKESLVDTHVGQLRSKRKSLLNGDRMADKLLDALGDMSDTARKLAPLVDRVDLSMTATDLRGLAIKLFTSNSEIFERRHDANFDFGFQRIGGVERNDFTIENDPFLAFVARASASIVPVFEPFTLGDMYQLCAKRKPALTLDQESFAQQFGRFYRDYWHNSNDYGIHAPSETEDLEQRRAKFRRSFLKREFGDGSYIDNYPFEVAISRLQRRTATLPVTRKLLYVEPDPTQFEPDDFDVVPTLRLNLVQQIAKGRPASLTLTIRQDLERIRDRNIVLLRVRSAAKEVEDAAQTAEPVPPPPSYYLLRVSVTTDDIANMICEGYGLEEDTPNFRAIRYLVRAWRDEAYPDEPSQRKMLKAFDFGFLFRYIDYLQLKCNELIAKVEPNGSDPPPIVQRCREIKSRLVQLDGQLRTILRTLDTAFGPRESWTTQTSRFLNSGNAEDPALLGARNWIEIPFDKLPAIFRSEIESERHEAARRMLNESQNRCGLFETGMLIEEHLLDCLQEVKRAISEEGSFLLNTSSEGAEKHFLAVDAATFPILYGAEATEADFVDILRVSSLDSNSIAQDIPHHPRLAGTGLGHFSGFFHPMWRREDILWGRLDAAEQLIEILMRDAEAQNSSPAEHGSAEDRKRRLQRAELVFDAQLAILASPGIEVPSNPGGELSHEEKDQIDCMLSARLRRAAASYTRSIVAYRGPEAKGDLSSAFPIEESVNQAFEERIQAPENEAIAPEIRRLWDLNAEYTRPQLKPSEITGLVGRSCTITSEMFKGLQREREENSVPVRLLGGIGQLLTGIGLAITPSSLQGHFLRHGFSLLAMFAGLLVALSTLIPEIRTFAWILFWGLILMGLLGYSLFGPVRSRRLALYHLGLFTVALVGLAAISAATVAIFEAGRASVAGNQTQNLQWYPIAWISIGVGVCTAAAAFWSIRRPTDETVRHRASWIVLGSAFLALVVALTTVTLTWSHEVFPFLPKSAFLRVGGLAAAILGVAGLLVAGISGFLEKRRGDYGI